MRVERWFNVLVLGGAALGNACAEPGDGTERSPVAGGAGGSAAGAGGSSVTGGSSAASAGGSAGSKVQADGGNASGASSGNSAGGTSGDGGGGSFATGGTGAGTGGTEVGTAGAGGGAQLECHVRDNGVGDVHDPCGCPCCWARDCLNTDEVCCAGFCKGADEGRGCCLP